MKKLVLLLFSICLIIASCNKDDEVAAEQNDPQTFVKQESEILSVGTNTITLTGNQNDIETNDIIVSGANNNAPLGFLRRVTNIDNSSGNTVLQTQRVALSEAVKHYYQEDEEFEGSTSYTFQPNDLSGRNSNQNSSVPITIPIDETITTTQGGVPIEINLSGDLTITPSIDFDISISNNNLSPNIEEFLFSISTENDFNVIITTQVDVSFNTGDIELGSFTGAPITITVGIPIVIIPKFTLYIGANGDLNASIVYTYSNNSTAISGVTYDNGWQFLPENGFSVNSQDATATASVSGNAKAYIKPEFSLSLYDDDFVSSGISVEPYARFEGSITSTQYNWLINGGIDTGAFFNAQAFGFSLVDEEWNNLINIPEWEIASGGYDIATITNPVPTDNATVTNQPITFSWQPNDFTETPNYEILLGTDSNALNSIGNTTNTSFEYTSSLSNDTYYWKVIARDTNNDIITESLIFSFILNENSTVDAVNTPNPTNGATDIEVNGSISFTEGANTPTDATFKVYFDSNTDPTTEFNLDADTNTLNYSNLQEGTAYYWKVETVSNTGNVLATSPIWSFTTLTSTGNTEPVFNPTPNDGVSDVSINGSLSFTEGVNTPTDATYRLYFDTNTTPTTQYDLGNQTSYNYSSLQENTTYYWFVETLSNSGDVLATSTTWSFTTENNSSGGVYEGDITLMTQQEVNDFGANNYSSINGYLNFSNGNSVTDLTPLNTITSVQGLLIAGDSITNLDGLESLTNIEFDLDIWSADALTNVDGLINLNTVGRYLHIQLSENIQNLNGFQNLTNVGVLNTSSFSIRIKDCDLITNLDGFSGLNDVDSQIIVTNNQILNNFCGFSNLINNNGLNGNFSTSGNAYNPTQQDIIDGNCSQ